MVVILRIEQRISHLSFAAISQTHKSVKYRVDSRDQYSIFSDYYNSTIQFRIQNSYSLFLLFLFFFSLKFGLPACSDIRSQSLPRRFFRSEQATSRQIHRRWTTLRPATTAPNELSSDRRRARRRRRRRKRRRTLSPTDNQEVSKEEEAAGS